MRGERLVRFQVNLVSNNVRCNSILFANTYFFRATFSSISREGLMGKDLLKVDRREEL